MFSSRLKENHVEICLNKLIKIRFIYVKNSLKRVEKEIFISRKNRSNGLVKAKIIENNWNWFEALKCHWFENYWY